MTKNEQSRELTVPGMLDVSAKRPESGWAIAEIRKALPNHLSAERIARVALTTWRNSADLQKCTPVSFMSAVVQAAQLGLEPNNAIGQAYLIPYGKDCTLVIGYKGLIHLAHRSPDVLMIEGHAVRKADKFSFEYGSSGYIKHVPEIEDEPEQIDGKEDYDRKNIRCFWAGIQLRGGAYKFQVMSARDIWDAEKRYVKAKGGPWKTNYAEMGIKTVLRRLLKQVPLTVELAEAVAVDEASERGDPVNMGAAEMVIPDSRITEAQVEELKKLAISDDKAEALDAWLGANGYSGLSAIPAARFGEAKQACR